jgi:hypothetical protein
MRIVSIFFLIVLLSGYVFSGNIEITKVGEFGTGHYRDVFVQGNYAYCAASQAGLDIIDISNPENPVKIGNCDTPGSATGVYLKGNYIYVADSTNGLVVIDVSNPASPVLAGSYTFSTNIFDVYVCGNYAYMAAYASGLKIIDVSDPTSPKFTGSFHTTGYAFGVYARGNHVYAAVNQNGLEIIDVSDPSSPTLAGNCDTPGSARGVYVEGNYAYVADGGEGLQIINISNPSSPSLAGNYDTTGNNAYGVYVSGDYAYVADRGRGLQIIDISNPISPKLAGDYDTHGNANKVHTNENYAYVACGEGGMQIINISIPQFPTWMGSYEKSASLNGVYVQGNYAYLADHYSGLYVIDVSNPRSPLLVGNYHTGSKWNLCTYEVYISGNYAYLANGDYMIIINVSDPTSPTLAGKYNTPFYAYGIFVKGNSAYVADQLGGLLIIDVSNPTSPVLSGSYSTSGYAVGVHVSDNYAYVTTLEGNLLIIDVSNPASPNLAATYNISRKANKVFVRDNYAYVSGGYSGLQILDISNPISPTFVGNYDTSGTTQNLYVKGNYAYLADLLEGLQIINISDPASPTLVVTYDTPGSMRGVYVDDNYVYAADGESGKLLILEMSELCTLNVQSSPFKGVPVGVSPIDNSGNSDGNTNFTRKYKPGTQVRLTAPATCNGSIFTKWIVNGIDNSNPSIDITMDNAHTVTAEYQMTTLPYISLNRIYMTFGAEKFGSSTGSQTLLIDNIGGGSLNWNVIVAQNWLHCIPSSGTGAGSVSVSINPSGLSPGSYSDTIKIYDPNAANSPQTVSVKLYVYGAGQTSGPFGHYSTPLNGSKVRSSVPFTGWVLDDIGIESVKLYRQEGKKLHYIGDAVFVEGARPDVEILYPDYPNNDKAGWGYMMLTNFLPNGGNGIFTIHAIAKDNSGNQVTLGKKTITVDNANAIKPFGAIDTPTQGGTASGSAFINFGWVLTPLPNIIPKDGSTIHVWINGRSVGQPKYNIYRDDIAALFPGYNNSNGAMGYFKIDTTQYQNGVHTIAWSATDNAGNSAGIGSRYITIQNPNGNTQKNEYFKLSQMIAAPNNCKGLVGIKRGYDLIGNLESQFIYPDEKGILKIKIEELERIKIKFFQDSSVIAGYLIVGGQLRPLPIGSKLDSDNCIFYWLVGSGFIGDYEFIFIEKNQNGKLNRRNIVITIIPKYMK